MYNDTLIHIDMSMINSLDIQFLSSVSIAIIVFLIFGSRIEKLLEV